MKIWPYLSSLGGDESSAGPKIVAIPVYQAVLEDSKIKIIGMAETMNIANGYVYLIHSHNLSMRKLTPRWKSHLLTGKEKHWFDSDNRDRVHLLANLNRMRQKKKFDLNDELLVEADALLCRVLKNSFIKHVRGWRLISEVRFCKKKRFFNVGRKLFSQLFSIYWLQTNKIIFFTQGIFAYTQ